MTRCGNVKMKITLRAYKYICVCAVILCIRENDFLLGGEYGVTKKREEVNIVEISLPLFPSVGRQHPIPTPPLQILINPSFLHTRNVPSIHSLHTGPHSLIAGLRLLVPPVSNGLSPPPPSSSAMRSKNPSSRRPGRSFALRSSSSARDVSRRTHSDMGISSSGPAAGSMLDWRVERREDQGMGLGLTRLWTM